MKKSKLITMAVSFLLTIGMIGAGFAAWVITAPTVKETEGSVSVDTVIDKRVKFNITKDNVNMSYYEGTATKTISNGDINVAFGKPASPASVTGVTPWLTYGSDTPVEDMSSVLSFTITNQQQLATALENELTQEEKNAKKQMKIKITLTIDSGISSANKFISPPDTATVSIADNYVVKGTDFIYDTTASKPATMSAKSFEIPLNKEANDSLTVFIKYDFNWGSAFASDNPYNYFNFIKEESTYKSGRNPSDQCNNTAKGEDDYDFADFAKTALSSIYEMRNNEIKITIKAEIVKSLKVED